MNFSWLKDLPTKCKETVKVAGEISKEAVKMTGEFIRDNPQLIVKTIASSVAVYYTAKGIAYSKKLEEIRKNYLRECNEKYKN